MEMVFRNLLALVIGTLLLPLASTCGWQDQKSAWPLPDPNEEPVGYANLALGTWGGKQFWTDFLHRDGWRIQRNAMSGHYRLLDPNDRRRAWGNYSHCLAELRTAVPQDPSASRPDVVVLLHGLGRSRSSFEALGERLHASGYRVINFSYASTRETLEDHAAALEHVVRHLEQAQRISFVGHSLGNLVVRRYLHAHPEIGKQEPQRFRMVMLGPPNLGAQLARRFRNNPLFELVWGASGSQLSQHWEELEPRLATPDFTFGILAGGGNVSFSNPLVEGEDDLIVSVEETRLAGADDFRRVAVSHTFMPWDEEVMELTERFLKEGWFESEATRQPVLAEEPHR